jgi:hypothetical protein
MARGAGLSGGGASRFSFAGKGLRETATGIGILAARDPTPFVWARVGGDALDLGTALFAALAGRRSGRGLATLAAVGGIAALDLACAQTLSAVRERQTRPVPDYSKRSGFPKGIAQARGAARETRRIPEAVRSTS